MQGRCAPLRRSAMRRAPELIGRTDCARARNAGPARLAPELDARAASSRLPNERLRYALFLLLDHYEMAAKWAEEKKKQDSPTDHLSCRQSFRRRLIHSISCKATSKDTPPPFFFHDAAAGSASSLGPAPLVLQRSLSFPTSAGGGSFRRWASPAAADCSDAPCAASSSSFCSLAAAIRCPASCLRCMTNISAPSRRAQHCYTPGTQEAGRRQIHPSW